jgi:tetratricopeptide (TPR) repeat protein
MRRICPTPHPIARTLCILLLVCVALVNAFAQIPTNSPGQAARDPKYVPGMSSYDSAPGTGVLIFHVFAEKAGAPLGGQARLDLTNLANHFGVFQIIQSDGEGVFVNIAFGNYEIEASALGYLPVRQPVQVVSTMHPQPIDIVLQRDPSAIDLKVTEDIMSPKARKEARDAVSMLKVGDYPEAQKHLERAYKLAPSNSDLNFLFGYLYFQQNNYARAETYLTAATSVSPNNAPALTLLGRSDLAQENYPAARSALERAILADDSNLLADAYLRQKDYGKARDEAQIALGKGQKDGKTVASPAELVLAQALIGLGQDQEAIQALDVFLKDSPQNPMVYQVQHLIADLKRNSSSAPDGSAKASDIDTSRADPLGAVPDPAPTTRTWRPPDVDDARPILTPGVVCPVAQVTDESGKRVQELVRDLTRFAANEDLFHQSIDAFGFATHTETRKYDYVAMVSEAKPGGAVSIEEYRADKPPQTGYPDDIASTGFITLALVFHPEMQPDFDLDCEGQTDWRGQPSWLVHFRQRRDRANRMHGYMLGGQLFPVDLKGRAWITADKFQIVRIEADMVKPMPEIQLLSEHQTVEYGPVPFPTKNTTLWLPKTAEIYFDFRKHRYHRRHSFDHFLLFSVDTEDKPKTTAVNP